MKRFIAILSSFIMIFTLIGSACFAASFPDVDESHWAFQYITKLSDDGVINGYQDGTYKPEGTVKRSEFLKLVLASVMPKDVDVDEIPTPFDHWAAGYVGIAQNYGVINEGEYTLDNIEKPITRIEMARIIANADIIMKESSISKSSGDTVLFIDIGELSPQDLLLMDHCVSSGLIKGYEDGTFRPEKTMTRAEAATMIYRFIAK
ncbi:MAG: S-layer homology domain-containing protein [Clostridia bacterium]|nr:S-layer homology domain-containing protein [Clostridia bacterium]